MTLRAFITGLAAVAALSLLDPYSSYIKGYGWLVGGAFPVGAVVLLVVLTLGGNLLLKLLRRGWELTRPELMLVWCMLIAAAVVPSSGLGRWWFHMTAGGAYLARRPDLHWEEGGSLTHVPGELVLSKNPNSTAAKQYYEGAPEGGRVPWSRWMNPLLHWGVFLLLLFSAVFCASGILRRQWVESERLMFPLARVPLEFTEGSAGGRLLPDLCYTRDFLLGVGVTIGLRSLQALPLLFGAASGVPLRFPFADMLQGTPLEAMAFDNVDLQLAHIGFAYLVTADVSLSIWFFFLFSRCELLVAHRLALPEAGGTWSPMMRWQQFGAYVAFAVAILYMARRHLGAVVSHALGRSKTDDSEEPIGYRMAFWGFLLAVGGCLGWYAWHGMNVLMGALILLLIFCWYLGSARIVAQGGIPVTRCLWRAGNSVGAILGPETFRAQGAVIASMQSNLLVHLPTTVIAPMAMMTMRISEVFKRRRRRLLVPALMVAILVAMACTTWVVLGQAYSVGALNFSDNWAPQGVPQGAFAEGHRMIQGRTTEWHRLHVRPLVLGLGGMAFLMFMRARFYWWPIHSIGFLTASTWDMMHHLWLAFLFGWAIKIGIMKVSGGRALRRGRRFFIGLIVTQSFLTGLSAIVGLLTGGAVPGF